MKSLYTLLCLFLLLAPSNCFSQKASEATAQEEVRKTLADFITAFDNLDWEKFRNAFADDATVFYPREFPDRANGRAEIETKFQPVFEQIKARKATAPYMDIQPRDLAMQILDDTAIVTFHLDDRTGFVNRRTVILHRTPSGWKIIHLHASEVAVGSGAASPSR
jgi:ketosteroid isomerase-like protein